MTARTKLKLVEPSAEFHLGAALRAAFAERNEAVLKVKRSDARIAEHGRRLAKERGVAFIRFEHLQQEFGK